MILRIKGEKDLKLDLLDFKFSFIGKSLNEYPEAVNLELLFDISEGYVKNLDFLLDIVASPKKRLVDFELTVNKGNIADISIFKGIPIIWGVRPSDGSVCRVEVEVYG